MWQLGYNVLGNVLSLQVLQMVLQGIQSIRDVKLMN